MYCHDRYKTNQYNFIPPDEPIGIKRNSNEVPLIFDLIQNYPNPFNSSTRIKYIVSKGGLVIIKVYDILGKEINTLVNEMKPAGVFEFIFNGNNLPSGIYFYRLQSGSISYIKKMLLIK